VGPRRDPSGLCSPPPDLQDLVALHVLQRGVERCHHCCRGRAWGQGQGWFGDGAVRGRGASPRASLPAHVPGSVCRRWPVTRGLQRDSGPCHQGHHLRHSLAAGTRAPGHRSAGSGSRSPHPPAQWGHSSTTQTREPGVPWEQPLRPLLADPCAPLQAPLPPSVPHAVPTARLCHPALPHGVVYPKRIVQNLGRRGQTQTQLRTLRGPGRTPHSAQEPQHPPTRQQHPQTRETPEPSPGTPGLTCPRLPDALCRSLPGPGVLSPCPAQGGARQPQLTATPAR